MKHQIRASVMTLAVAVSVSAQTPDAAGSWNVRVNAPDGPHDATLTLTKSGEALTGTIKGADGEYKVEGTQKGMDVSLSFTYKGNDGPVPITLKGTIAGDAVSGPVTLGDSAGASAASPATSSALDVTGAWAFEVTTPNGSGTPTVTFTQAGEKLTGTYAGQFGEAPIEGTLKNGQISFGIDLTIQDMKLHITYAGTVTKDGMKGTASFGDFGEGAFTAHRK
jgi:hypothetical protein